VSAPLAGRTALVTGGAERVGRALCVALAEAGADVVVNHRNQPEAAAETVARIAALGRRAVAEEADVTDAAAVARMFDRHAIDLLVNSAATFVQRPFLDLTAEDWDVSMGAILKGAFLCTQAAARGMLARGFGRIANIAGISVYEAWPDYVSHAVAKAALVKLTECSAVALAPTVQVNCIAPGTLIVNGGGRHEAVEQPVRGTTPTRGTPDDLARTLVFLFAAPAYLSGATIPLDGGRRLAR
jgi:NAD(P)-dependent dehydrogenase (short-subunit alcohol dehydrogenase family)